MSRRKNQIKRLKKAKANVKKNGGTIIWRDGKPVVTGGARQPKTGLDPGKYLELENPVPLSSVIADPPPEGEEDEHSDSE